MHESFNPIIASPAKNFNRFFEFRTIFCFKNLLLFFLFSISSFRLQIIQLMLLLNCYKSGKSYHKYLPNSIPKLNF